MIDGLSVILFIHPLIEGDYELTERGIVKNRLREDGLEGGEYCFLGFVGIGDSNGFHLDPEEEGGGPPLTEHIPIKSIHVHEQFLFDEECDEGFEEEGSRRCIRGGVGFWEGGGEFEVGLEVVCVVGFDVAGEGMKDGFEMDTTHSGLQCYGFKFLISISINQIWQSTLSISSYSPLSTTLHAICTSLYLSNTL